MNKKIQIFEQKLIKKIIKKLSIFEKNNPQFMQKMWIEVSHIKKFYVLTSKTFVYTQMLCYGEIPNPLIEKRKE